MPATLVRLGHILEGGRSASMFEAKIQELVNKSFRWRLVAELPAGHARWEQEARRVLALARGARDMDAELIEDCVAGGTSD